VHWTPNSALYPEFDGNVLVRAEDTYAVAALEIDGGYTPPGGPLGNVFDLLLGRRIAHATARALLKRIGSEMVERYKRDEETKRIERERISDGQ